MGDAKLIKAIAHYQQNIERYLPRNEDAKMLHCISRLHGMPIKLNHLQETGVGRTVNSLRKYAGEVGEAARELVNKWKSIVEESNEDDDNESANNSSQSEKSVASSSQTKYKKEENGGNNSSDNDDDGDANNYEETSHCTKQEYSRKSVKKKSRSKSSSSRRREEKKHKSSDEESTNDLVEVKQEHLSDEEDYVAVKNKKRKERKERSHKSRNEETVKIKQECNSDEEDCVKSKKRKRDDNKKDHSHKSRKRTEEKSRKHKSSDESSSEETVKIKQEKLSDDEEDYVAKETLTNGKHNSSKLGESSKHSSNNDSKYKEKKRESSSSSSSKHKKHSKDKSHKSSSSKSKSSHSKSSSGSHKSSSSSSSKKKLVLLDDGIDSQSGASFAEALGMLMPAGSSKTSSKKEKSTPPSSSSKSKDVAPLLSCSMKLEPLDLKLSSLLPTISPNYKPLNPLLDVTQRGLNKPTCDTETLTKLMYSKNQRTKVYSGNKTFMGKIPSLFDLCVRILQDNIDAIEFTGGIPYSILKPILERASPEQLFQLENYNPYLVEDTDELWQLHCNRQFRGKKREEMESWREMHLRCSDERDAKLKALTANIKLAQDKSVPVRQTKLAYVDAIVKPPRNIAKKQMKNGIPNKPNSATPSSKVAALAVSGLASQIAVPNPVREMAAARSSVPMKPKKAPLMAKSLALMKGFRR